MARITKEPSMFGGWTANTTVDGKLYFLTVKKGRYVGKYYGKRAWRWHGFVYLDGKILWGGDVDKTISAKRLLSFATEKKEKGN